MTTASASRSYNSAAYQRAKQRQLLDPLGYKAGREILAAIGRYGYLTHAQITRLLYAPTSGTMVNEWLQTLKGANLVHDENWLRRNPTGKNPRVWTFTEKARRLLTDQGLIDLPSIHHRRIISPWVLDHTIAVNDALLTLELLTRRSSGAVELLGLMSDELLHKHPVVVTLANGKTANVIPDGWIAYGFPQAKESFCLEVDRGTERAAEKWRSKIRAYVACAMGTPSPYKTAFGFDAPNVITVVRPKEGEQVKSAEGRIADLKKWTEDELLALGKKSWALLFRFTTQPPEETDPRFFVGANLWETPFSPTKAPLLEGVL